MQSFNQTVKLKTVEIIINKKLFFLDVCQHFIEQRNLYAFKSIISINCPPLLIKFLDFEIEFKY